MAERSVVVRLAANVGSYVSSLGQAKKATDDISTAADKAGQSSEKSGQKQQNAAQKAAAAAAATAAALGKEAAAVQDSAKAHDMHYNSSGKLVDANNKFVSSAAAAEAGLSTFSKEVRDAAKAADDAAAAAARAGGPIKKLGQTLDEVAASAKKNRQAWDQAGGALTAFGAVAVGALGFAAKAAMEWESAWAGVTKTVDGTPEQMAELETGLRGLAKTLPTTHVEIAAVAEAAGQLGVAQKDVLGFTKTMIDLGQSTNLTAEEAATSIAQISNITGLMAREGAEGVGRFGATLVELGNNSASTEADILAMSQRIAGAMTTVGGTEVDILAVSTALASMGVKAELGGGVTTRVLLGMYSSIKDGGAELEAFAATAGTSASEFAAAFERSPVEALALVSQGLGTMKDEGGNVVAALSDMGFKGTETTQVMLALANSGDLLTASQERGNVAWRENTALLEEASKRYATTESQIAMALSSIKDAAIDMGGMLLPVVAKVAGGAVELAEAWQKLPEPVQNGIVAMTGVVGAAALVAGGFLLVVPRVLDTVGAFKTLKSDMPGLASGLGKVGAAAGIAAGAFVGFEVIKGIHNSMQPATKSVEEMTQSLIGLKDNAGAFDDVFANLDPGTGGAILKNVHDVGDALAALDATGPNAALSSFGATVLGVDNDTAKMLATVEKMDQTFSNAASSGNLELAAKGFKAVADGAKENDVSMESVMARFPEYKAQLEALANSHEYVYKEGELFNAMLGKLPPGLTAAMNAAEGAEGGVDAAGAAAEAAAAEMEEAAAAAEEFADAMEEVGLSTEGVIVDLQKFTDMLFALGMATMSSRDAAFGWESTLRGMGTAAQEVLDSQWELGSVLNATGTDFNEMTEAGKNANEMMQGIVSEGMQVAETFAGDMSKSTADVNQQLRETYDAGIAAAEGLGLGKDEAIALTREMMGIPTGVSIDTWMSDVALRTAGETEIAMDEIPDSIWVNSAMDTAAFETAGMTKQGVEDIPDQATIDAWMGDAAFIEAIRTRAAAEGIPPDVAVASFMESAARNEADSTTAQILKIPTGASVSAYMDAYIRDMAAQSKAALDAIDGRTVNTYANHHDTTYRSVVDLSDGSGAMLKGSQVGYQAAGGRIPRHADGGRLPTTGPGTEVTDGILGISSKDAQPVSWLDGGEWIINSKASDKHNSLLGAINRDDPRLSSLPGFATGGRIDGLSARPGEENWQWQSRQQRIVEQMADVVGGLADWEIHEDGSGWIRTMDNTMIEIADGAWKVSDSAALSARAMERASQDAYWAGQTATAAGGAFQSAGSQAFSAGGSFQAAGVSANATAGTFTVAGQVTQQAAQAIIAATAAVNAAGQQQANAQGGGLIAQAGESNATWQGRQDQFEQAIAQQFGGIKYSSLHEDGSGKIELDDGRKIDVNEGRWAFVNQHKYGWGPQGPQLSKYYTGGRLPAFGPGTDRRDGFMGVSSITGEPAFMADGGEWIVNAKSSARYDDELAAMNAGTFPKLTTTTQQVGRQYAPAMGYAGGGGQQQDIAQAISQMTATANIQLRLDGRKLHNEIVKLNFDYGRN